jgi:intracellular sulfur oxidation DsrE/DsrF family protein
MKTLGWSAADMHDFVTVVPIGAEDLILLQEQGYSYLKW